MRISAIQPLSSIVTAASHTPSHVSSSPESLNSTPSPTEPAAVTENIEPVRWSWCASKATMIESAMPSVSPSRRVSRLAIFDGSESNIRAPT